MEEEEGDCPPRPPVLDDIVTYCNPGLLVYILICFVSLFAGVRSRAATARAATLFSSVHAGVRIVMILNYSFNF